MALPALRNRGEREAVAWNPVTELEQTTNRLARLVDEVWGSGWPTLGFRDLGGFLPPADLEETDDAYVVEVELPGVDRRDVDVEVAGRRVTVSGERKERERTGILRRRTRTVGRFHYEVTLPGDIDEDAVSANLADGVLTLRVPKSAAERRRRVPVQ
jgi:HSP20 family protein